MKIRRSHTPETWLKVPSCKAYKLLAIIPLIALSSCTFINDSLHFIGNIYTEDSPFTVTEYNEFTGEKPRLKLKGYEDIDINIGTEEFYIRKTIKLTDFRLDTGKKFRESEERKEAMTEILTLK